MPNDVYLQPDAPDPVLQPDVVLDLVRRHVPYARAVTGVDESGGEARTYAIDDNVILKVQRPHRLRERTNLAKEAMFLNALAANSTVPVPRVLGYGRDEGTIEYICMTRMPGVAVVSTALQPARRRAVLLKLGKILREIHQIPQAAIRESGVLPGDRAMGDLKTRLAAAFAEVVTKIESRATTWRLSDAPRQIVQHALKSLPPSDERVALHSNPGATHTFVDRATGVFTGLIDFGDAFISHPALDLRRWSSPVDRAALFAGYTTVAPVSAEFNQVWRVAMLLTDLTVIATSMEGVDDASADIRQLLGAL